MTITTTGQTGEAPVTTLAGRLRDQAALCGVLNTLHNLRLPFSQLNVRIVKRLLYTRR
jgi:hypothetical protein